MRELSLHILDLAQNSIEAGAHHVQIDINENENGYFTFAIADDGRGMSEEMVKKARDPFVTSRLTRKVGMGIPFMDMVTAQCGGYFDIKSRLGEGTVVKAAFKADNIDRPPLGDIAGSIAVLLAGAPQTDLVFTYSAAGGNFTFDTQEVRAVLGRETDFAHPEVYRWTEEYLRQQLDALHAGQED
ncbi:MAG: ATP-binding protein [Phascolarctobacterium sp.]|nr:MAG: ATP-binding protein [Phascolarctobacterium sp.]